ncbi:MAG: putative porin [Desulfobacteraceae bacterium]
MIKKIALVVLLAAALLTQAGPNPCFAAEVDVLINKLVEKGVLSPTEAGQLLNEMKNEGVRQEQTVKDLATEAAQEEAKKTVQVEAKNWAKVPDWVDRITFKGDFRLRYQYEDKKKSDGEKFTRNRGRYRWRFGAVADVTEDKKWQVGFGLASGSGDPRSTNQTFQKDFETPDARIDYAYAQYAPVKQVKAIAGQFKNPLYKTKDLLWDGDVRPQGVAVPIEVKANDRFAFFLNPGLFVLDHLKSQETNAWMFALQPGIKVKPGGGSYVKFAGTWYYNQDVKGTHFKYSSGTNTTDADGNLIYDYSSIAFDGEFGFNFSSYIQKLVFFGQFIKSDADDDSTGWLAGFKFGRSIKKLGDWEFKYNYRRLEKDAWLDCLPDSDFHGGDTNVDGHEVEFKLGLAKHLSLAMDYYHTQKINHEPGEGEPENVFQFDVKFKF